MMGKTHRIGGLCAGIICAETLYGAEIKSAITTNSINMGSLSPYSLLNIPTIEWGSLMLPLTIILVSTFFSLVPDIDSKTSTISKRMRITSFFVNLVVKHRGIMHTYIPYIIGGILVAFPFLMLSPMFNGLMSVLPCSLFGFYLVMCIGMIVGVTSHFLLDMITTQGVAILYPFCKKKISIAKLNGEKHGLIVSLICILITFLIVYYNFNGNFDFFTNQVQELIAFFTKEEITRIK